MRLYHTGTVIIKDPDLRHGRKNADFGQGFYLTPDRDFTYRWARRDAIVNVYELDETGLNIHRFTRDIEWFNYIFHNRRVEDTIDADVIIGPIANDTIFDTMGIISSGFLSPEEALKLLLIGLEYTQVVIKSEKAKAQLHWLSAEQITAIDESLHREEEAEYQKLFAEAMTK